MITIQDNYVIISRANYLWRNGTLNEADYVRIGDGDIIAVIHPDAYEDIKHAKEIVRYIDAQLREQQ